MSRDWSEGARQRKLLGEDFQKEGVVRVRVLRGERACYVQGTCTMRAFRMLEVEQTMGFPVELRSKRKQGDQAQGASQDVIRSLGVTLNEMACHWEILKGE